MSTMTDKEYRRRLIARVEALRTEAAMPRVEVPAADRSRCGQEMGQVLWLPARKMPGTTSR